jgi:putative transposase
MEIKDETLDELIAASKGELLGPEGLLKQLSKRLLERMLAGELDTHLGYEKHDPAGYGSGNSRNGKTQKTLKGAQGEMTIAVPRDRSGTFEPQIIEKHQTHFDGFDANILSLYARGMTTRDIQDHIRATYGVELSPTFVSNVTDRVVEDVKEWQNRPLEPLYPIVYLDALMMKIRHDGHVDTRAVYTAIGLNLEGQKSVLGLWVSAAEGAKFWLNVLTSLKNRGLKDVLILCTDGLKGFPEAIEAVYPQAMIQTCIVHLLRASLNYATWKERKALAADLKTVYRAVSAEAAEAALAAFRLKWPKHQVVADVWQRNWARVVPFFDFPEDIRRIIYTTNAIESLHMTLRKVTKNRGSFPSEEAALKLLYLALQNVEKKWHTVQTWKEALRHFMIRWGDRIEAATRVG